MADNPADFEAQDNAEAFDEDNLEGDDAGPREQEFKTFEELPDLFDDTARLGDGSADDRSTDESEFTEDLIQDEDLEDPLADRTDAYADEEGGSASDEVELEFQADVEGSRGAQGSAAHFESRRLNDDDLRELGYQEDEERPMTDPRNAAKPEAHRETNPDAAHARPAERTVPQDEKHDQLKKKEESAEDRQEALIDEGVEETFPASDPVSAKRIT